MRLARSFSILGVVTLAGASVLAGAQTRSLTKAELAKIQLPEGKVTNDWFVAPDRHSFHWQVSFRNDGELEIAEIELRSYASVNGRVLYRGAPIKIKTFANRVLPHNGSLLPYGVSDSIPSILTTFPQKLIEKDAVVGIDIVAAKAYTKEADPHDYGHLYTQMRKMTDDQCVALFKRDRSLLTPPARSQLLPEYLAYAAGGPKTIAYVLSQAPARPPKARLTPQQMRLNYLQCACLNPRTDVLESALKGSGMNLRAWPAMAWSPVERAIFQRNRAGWLYLLRQGANPRFERSDRMSLAQIAIQVQNVQALKDLMRFGAKPTDHDSLGFGWLHYAVTRYETIPAVHALGVPIDDRNTRDGRTPFALAFGERKMEAAIEFLKLGADPSAKDKQGRSAYDYERMSRLNGRMDYLNEIVRKYGKKRK